jgi:negative regulator of flagellin synthesis FlgM|tara:strand:- start:20 stop:331 length:312 start_codon:yes stop_codon:yes gene_type:complete
VEINKMDKITNNIINNLPKKEIKENNKSLNDLANSSPSVDKVMSSNVVDIKDTKKLVAEMAKSAPIDVDKVAKIKEAISSGKYPLDLDKLSDALMQAYREMKS